MSSAAASPAYAPRNIETNANRAKRTLLMTSSSTSIFRTDDRNLGWGIVMNSQPAELVNAESTSGWTSSLGVRIRFSISIRASPISRRRCLGSFSRQRRTNCRNALGVSAGSNPQSGARSRIAAMVSDRPPRFRLGQEETSLRTCPTAGRSVARQPPGAAFGLERMPAHPPDQRIRPCRRVDRAGAGPPPVIHRQRDAHPQEMPRVRWADDPSPCRTESLRVPSALVS